MSLNLYHKLIVVHCCHKALLAIEESNTSKDLFEEQKEKRMKKKYIYRKPPKEPFNPYSGIEVHAKQSIREFPLLASV